MLDFFPIQANVFGIFQKSIVDSIVGITKIW